MALFLTVLIVASTLTSTVGAVTVDKNNPGSFYDENFYNTNNIMYYNPHCSTSAGAATMQLAGKDTTEKVLNFFMRKGINFAASTGFVGNMMQESGLNPAIIQGGRIATDSYVLESGVGFGLVQWTSGGRQQKFMQFMKDSGVGVTDLSGQLEFVWKEVNESYPKTIQALQAVDNTPDGAVAAAVAVHGPPSPGYEASADSPEKVLTVRGGNAKAVFEKYYDGPALAGSTAEKAMTPNGEGSDDTKTVAAATTNGSPTSNCSGSDENANAGVLEKIIAKYAWHQFTAGRTDQQPEYAAAVASARNENRYVGGSNGNDCGGFVTLAMYDSGYDKTYNTNGRGGNTLHQIDWLNDPKNGWGLVPDNTRQTGDVAINQDHTYMYVDKTKMPSDWQTNIASASYPDRAPMAGTEGEQDKNFTWYRKKIK